MTRTRLAQALVSTCQPSLQDATTPGLPRRLIRADGSGGLLPERAQRIVSTVNAWARACVLGLRVGRERQWLKLNPRYAHSKKDGNRERGLHRQTSTHTHCAYNTHARLHACIRSQKLTQVPAVRKDNGEMVLKSEELEKDIDDILRYKVLRRYCPESAQESPWRVFWAESTQKERPSTSDSEAARRKTELQAATSSDDDDGDDDEQTNPL